MSKWSRDSDELEREIARGLIIQEFGPEGIDAIDYIGRSWRRA